MNISRLSPVDANHCDMAAVLAELQQLRAEVRQLRSLQSDVDSVKQQVEVLTSHQGVSNVSPTTSDAINITDFPPLVTSASHSAAAPASAAAVPVFSSMAADLQQSGVSDPRNRLVNKRAPKFKPVVGNAASAKLKSVTTKRELDIFVSRLDPGTESSDVISCVSDSVHNLSVADIKCTKLKSKHEDLYSSFHVCVSVCANEVKSMIELLMSADSWPEGLLVRRYFKPKNGSHI